MYFLLYKARVAAEHPVHGYVGSHNGQHQLGSMIWIFLRTLPSADMLCLPVPLSRPCSTLCSFLFNVPCFGVQGLTTASINWGAWAGAGMAARAGVERMERLGFGAINPQAGVAALGCLLIGVGRGEPCGPTTASIFIWDR
jgi:hypothetical protein